MDGVPGPVICVTLPCRSSPPARGLYHWTEWVPEAAGIRRRDSRVAAHRVCAFTVNLQGPLEDLDRLCYDTASYLTYWMLLPRQRGRIERASPESYSYQHAHCPGWADVATCWPGS